MFVNEAIEIARNIHYYWDSWDQIEITEKVFPKGLVIIPSHRGYLTRHVNYFFAESLCFQGLWRGVKQKKANHSWLAFLSSGDRTRTDGLRVMSPTSYQLLHPAIYLETCCFPYWDYKDTKLFVFCKLSLAKNRYRTEGPAPNSFSEARKLSLPSSFSAIKIIPWDSMPRIFLGSKFNSTKTVLPIISSGA